MPTSAPPNIEPLPDVLQDVMVALHIRTSWHPKRHDTSCKQSPTIHGNHIYLNASPFCINKLISIIHKLEKKKKQYYLKPAHPSRSSISRIEQWCLDIWTLDIRIRFGKQKQLHLGGKVNHLRILLEVSIVSSVSIEYQDTSRFLWHLVSNRFLIFIYS